MKRVSLHRLLFETGVLAIVLALTFRAGVAQAFVVDGLSMAPTLDDGQRVLVLKLAYGLTLPFRPETLWHWDTPEAGDVVVVTSPVDEIDLVKRVVAVEGQTVELREGRVFIDDRPLATGRAGTCFDGQANCNWVEESVDGEVYVTRFHSGEREPENRSAFVVPEGQVYVLGDHRDRSNDSRFFGPISVDNVRGRVLL